MAAQAYYNYQANTNLDCVAQNQVFEVCKAAIHVAEWSLYTNDTDTPSTDTREIILSEGPY